MTLARSLSVNDDPILIWKTCLPFRERRTQVHGIRISESSAVPWKRPTQLEIQPCPSSFLHHTIIQVTFKIVGWSSSSQNTRTSWCQWLFIARVCFSSSILDSVDFYLDRCTKQIERITCACGLSELPADWANYVGIGVGERQWVGSCRHGMHACTRVVVWAFIVLRRVDRWIFAGSSKADQTTWAYSVVRPQQHLCVSRIKEGKKCYVMANSCAASLRHASYTCNLKERFSKDWKYKRIFELLNSPQKG